MPISEDEWKDGRTLETTEAKVLAFLRKNKGLAFTSAEIWRALGYTHRTDDFWALVMSTVTFWGFLQTLKDMVKEGSIKAKVVKKEIGAETYYLA